MEVLKVMARPHPYCILWVLLVVFALAMSALAQGAELDTLRFVPPVGHGAEVNAVAFSATGKYAASGADDKTVRLWEVATGRELRQFIGHEMDVKAVAFSPDEKYLASASDDGTLRLWDMTTGRQARLFATRETENKSGLISPDGKEAPSGIKSVAFSADGKHILSGGKTAQLWETES